MGFQTLLEFMKHLDRFELRLLARKSKKNLKKLAPYINREGITVEWGDLMNLSDVKRAMGNSDYVLHIGGMVSPMADHYPELTMKVNVTSAINVVQAAKELPNVDEVKVAYIGSVAMTSCHNEPYHWGRIGDPIIAAEFDHYSLSKIESEKIFAESGLKHWVSLRQSGILHKGLIFKGSDPISFHVPLRGVLEWATVEDSARLMVNLCDTELPKKFWRNFYNIGSGKNFRMSNYRFEKLLMKALGCPPPEKVFETKWFALKNFHGEWYDDSDVLEEYLHFREDITAEEYFARLASEMPWYMSLTPIVPAFVIKYAMKRVALRKDLGTLYWLRHDDCEDRIRASFGSRETQANIPDWDEFDNSEPSEISIKLDHGYDERMPDEELDIDVMRKVAEFRGGKCLSKSMIKGDLHTRLEWECAFGHKFKMSPLTVLKGGHWCPECLPTPWRYDEEVKVNPFIAQIWS